MNSPVSLLPTTRLDCEKENVAANHADIAYTCQERKRGRNRKAVTDRALCKCFPLELDEGMPHRGGSSTPNRRGLLVGTSREQATWGGTRYIDSPKFTATV